MEFLAARAKNIPIYIFINKQIINLLTVHQKNKKGDYSNIVDTPEIVEFANDLRNASGLWTFEFEKFQDIMTILKGQLSYLFKESLQLRNKINNSPDLDFYAHLSSKASRIIVFKGKLFEYEFLSQVFVDEIKKYELLKKDCEYKIVLKSDQALNADKDFLQWITLRMSSLTAYIPTLINLINKLIPKYLNEPGRPADLKGFFYVAKTFARVLEAFINWSIDTSSVTVQTNQRELRDIVAEFNSKAIETIWSFPFLLEEEINQSKTGFNLLIDVSFCCSCSGR